MPAALFPLKSRADISVCAREDFDAPPSWCKNSFLSCATLSSLPVVTGRWGGTWPGAPPEEEATDTYQPLCLGPHAAAQRMPFDLI